MDIWAVVLCSAAREPRDSSDLMHTDDITYDVTERAEEKEEGENNHKAHTEKSLEKVPIVSPCQGLRRCTVTGTWRNLKRDKE
ncbi:hypothetical protein FKM82_029393 [Ascaphus truei]